MASQGGYRGRGHRGNGFNNNHSSPSNSPRAAIAADTISRSAHITAGTPHASTTSIFLPSQLPPLPPNSSPNHSFAPLRVITGDTIAHTLHLASQPALAPNVAVLNMANETHLAGGWAHRFGQTQEDVLCYSTTLHSTLASHATPANPNGVYPWRAHGKRGSGNVQGLFSPGVVVFKEPVGKGGRDLPEHERRVVSVISVAAPRLPRNGVVVDPRGGRSEVTDQRRLGELREKIKLVCRAAAWEGKTVLVLGAMGCGSFNWPAEVVAWEMKSILMDLEFRGWFEEVCWVVFDQRTAGAFRKVIEE